MSGRQKPITFTHPTDLRLFLRERVRTTRDVSVSIRGPGVAMVITSASRLLGSSVHEVLEGCNAITGTTISASFSGGEGPPPAKEHAGGQTKAMGGKLEGSKDAQLTRFQRGVWVLLKIKK